MHHKAQNAANKDSYALLKIGHIFQKQFWVFKKPFNLETISHKNSKTCKLPDPLFNVGCKFAWSITATTVWYSFFRLSTTLNIEEGETLGIFEQV